MNQPFKFTYIVFSMVGIFICITAILLAVETHREMPKQVWSDGRKYRIQTSPGTGPTVVFESYGPGKLEGFSQVQVPVSKFARTFLYNHAGFWGSEPGPIPRDAEQIARELRALLEAADMYPPFVMVGFSFGGPLYPGIRKSVSRRNRRDGVCGSHHGTIDGVS